MGHKVTLGGDRLGSGKKDKVEIRHYERSNHDLSEIFRTSASAGTLIPFLCKPMLPTDVWDIDLDVNVMTHPTVGPLFGSAKVQLDLFRIPVRLYNGLLHMNKTELGLKISDVKLPQIKVEYDYKNPTTGIDKYPISPSCLLSYLGIKGIGYSSARGERERLFNGVPLLAYWDIVKNYYSNKQEEVGGVINVNDWTTVANVQSIRIEGGDPILAILDNKLHPSDPPETVGINDNNVIMVITGYRPFTIDETKVEIINSSGVKIDFLSIFPEWEWSENGMNRIGRRRPNQPTPFAITNMSYFQEEVNINNVEPQVTFFPLSNIDDMRMDILSKVKETSAFEINENSAEPYNLTLDEFDTPFKGGLVRKMKYGQQGLAVKTYQSDIFNNWLDTEWIDGESGINNLTAVQVENGEFTLDALMLARKVYDMLNNIAVSGGSYYDWMSANWGHDALRQVESPVYEGGLSKELVFQEVVSNAAAQDTGTEQPLGTLAGRGVLSNKHKGGRAVVKADEISYIMGIFSITPRIDYSQGNNWDMNLKTLDDFHKPALDQIGFQDLLTDQMAWWDTEIESDNSLTYKSAGKQPAWLNYQTSYNKTFGSFAIEEEEMFMTFNRRYESNPPTEAWTGITDLTTYIDPKKFNYIFADTRRDAQNYWVQIAVDIHARRQMSAKVMPNL